MSKVDELCKQLEHEADIEEVPFDEVCNKSLEMVGCTRPLNHAGFHIAMGYSGILIAMWHDNISYPEEL